MTEKEQAGERIAKVMARSGVASRRDAERMIVEGRVAVNGKTVTSPALDVAPSDRVTLDGKPIDAPQAARLWLYYKPLGLVTSEKDEKGRQTVFESLPDGMPRVLSVGRLDLNSEGLLLLTNDGELKRRLELPSTGWLRKYRVRVNGRPNEATFDPLRRGIEIEGEQFQPMDIHMDRQQGANAWLTVGLREGKNREIRRAMAEVGLTVNRLIRVSYGPFRLNEMQPGDVIEVKQKVLREQLGDGKHAEGGDDRRARKPRPAPGGDRPARGAFGRDGDRPRPPRGEGEKRPYTPRPRPDDGASAGEERKERKPRHGSGSARPVRDGAGQDRKAYAKRDGDSRPPRATGGDRKPYARRDGESRPPRAEGADRKPFVKRDGDSRPPRGEGPARKPYVKRDGEGADRKPYPRREGDSRPPRAGGAERKPYAKRDGEEAERKPYAKRDGDNRPPRSGGAGGKPYAKRDGDSRPPRAEGGERKPWAKPAGARFGGNGPAKEGGGRPSRDRPRGPAKGPRGPKPTKG